MDLDSLLNMDTVDMLREMDEGTGFFADLISEYVAQSTTLLSTIHAGIQADDLQKVGAAVHTLKGSSLNLGAEAVGQQCAQLEVAIHENDRAAIAAHATALDGLFEQTTTSLESLL